MKKIIAITFCFMLSVLYGHSAELPVAVVAPVEITDETIKNDHASEIEVIHELLSGELANTRIIKMVARTEAIMKQILTEHGFQETTWSDKTKTAALGKALNADIIIRVKIIRTKNN